MLSCCFTAGGRVNEEEMLTISTFNVASCRIYSRGEAHWALNTTLMTEN